MSLLGWDNRPVNWDQPGHSQRGDEKQRILDQIELLSQGNPSAMVYKSSNTQINNASTGTTFVNDPHLQFEALAGEVYRVKLEITYEGSTAGDFKQRFLLPSGATFWNGTYRWPNAVSLATSWAALSDGDGQVTGLGATGAGNKIAFGFMGTLAMGSTTGGTVAWQWAQDTADATNTIVHRGSVLSYVLLDQ